MRDAGRALDLRDAGCGMRDQKKRGMRDTGCGMRDPAQVCLRQREKEEREKEKEKERKGFSPFRNPIFLDECTYISKQSKNA